MNCYTKVGTICSWSSDTCTIAALSIAYPTSVVSSIVAGAIRSVVTHRANGDEEKAAARKESMVSLYGVTARIRSQSYTPICAGMVTTAGAALLAIQYRVAVNNKAKVVFGDTDGMMLNVDLTRELRSTLESETNLLSQAIIGMTGLRTFKFVAVASTTVRAKQIAYLKSNDDHTLAKLKGFAAIKRQVPLIISECICVIVTNCLKCTTRSVLLRTVANSAASCWSRIIDELARDDAELASYSRGESTVVDVVARSENSMSLCEITRIKLDELRTGRGWGRARRLSSSTCDAQN